MDKVLDRSAIKATEMTVSFVDCGQSWKGALSLKPIRVRWKR